MEDKSKLGPSDGDAVVQEMEEQREQLFGDINKKLHGATVTEIVEYEFSANTDPEITCIICNRGNCDLASTAYETTVFGDNARVIVGKHSGCRRRPVAALT